MSKKRTATLDEALNEMRERGFCLWIGAGVTIHLAGTLNVRIPGWPSLTTEFEDKAGLPSSTGSYPSRLEKVLAAVSREEFSAWTRAALVAPLAEGVLKHCQDNNAEPPEALASLIALGTRANPIVSFNLETYTSSAIGFSLDVPYRIRAFHPNLKDARLPPATRSPVVGREDTFRRHIYHPHGATELSGPAVLTTSEYASMRGSLALELAVHSAFGQSLAIVGMSLDDDYLREQILKFRDELDSVYWFSNRASHTEYETWMDRAHITAVDVSTWQNFWEQTKSTFPVSSKTLESCWYNLFRSADLTVNSGAELHSEVLTMDAKDLPLNETEELLKEKQAVDTSAELRGELNVPIDHNDRINKIHEMFDERGLPR